MAHFTCNFLSYVFNRAVTIDVIIPTLSGPEIDWKGDVRNNTHQVKEPYPLLYLLHGGINDYSTWERYTSIERYAEERQIAVVTFSAENKSYLNLGTSGPSSPSLLGDRDNFYDFAAIELPDFLSSIFPVTRDPRHTYMAGLSMGGGGTMLHGFTRPESFRALGIFSMAPCFEGHHELAVALMCGEAFQRCIRDARKLPRIYMACGQNDFLYDQWITATAQMKAAGVDITTDEMAGYGHEWAFWDLQIQKFLDWIPRDDGYALQCKKRRI